MAQVQGEEIYLSHSGQEVDDNIDEVVAARGSEASLSARLADIVSDFETDQQRQEAEIGAVAALGAKNLFNIDGNAEVYSCTYTHADNVLAITGTGGYARVAFPITLPAGDYNFTANAVQLSGSGRVRFNTASAGAGTTIAPDIDITNQGNISQTISLEAETTFYVMLYSKVTSGTGESSAVFSKIMIRRAEITDSTYVPYAPTNRELYEMILALQSGRSVQSAASLMQAGRIDAELTDAGTGEEEDA